MSESEATQVPETKPAVEKQAAEELKVQAEAAPEPTTKIIEEIQSAVFDELGGEFCSAILIVPS